jgi:hypothetical protein
MVTHKARLISLLIAEVALIALHVLLREPMGMNSSVTLDWHAWLAFVGGIVLIGYALSIRCPVPNCRRHQVFRGMSFFDLRLPGERCYVCNAPLEKSKCYGTAQKRAAP